MNNNNPEGYFFFTTVFASKRPPGGSWPDGLFGVPAAAKDAYHADRIVPMGPTGRGGSGSAAPRRPHVVDAPADAALPAGLCCVNMTGSNERY
jgi:hypothetical protein